MGGGGGKVQFASVRIIDQFDPSSKLPPASTAHH